MRIQEDKIYIGTSFTAYTVKVTHATAVVTCPMCSKENRYPLHTPLKELLTDISEGRICSCLL